MIVKAMSEQGVRLNIRKATLRSWRREFARHLRALDVEANATERAVRAQTQVAKPDALYRTDQRGMSRHTRERMQTAAADLLKGDVRVEIGRTKLIETRRAVERGWLAAADILEDEGRHELAGAVRRFVERFEPARTDQERVVAALRDRARERSERSFTR